MKELPTFEWARLATVGERTPEEVRKGVALLMKAAMSWDVEGLEREVPPGDRPSV
jgi:hypothetical protein